MSKHKLVANNNAVEAENEQVEVKETKMSKIKEFGENHPKAKKALKYVAIGAGSLAAAAGAFVAGRMTAPGNEDQYDDGYSEAPYEEAYAESEEE